MDGEQAVAGKSVVRAWVSRLQLKEQAVLLAAIRGCDMADKHHATKMMTRAIRRAILHNACRALEPFMAVEPVPPRVPSVRFSDYDNMPSHFLTHTLHAVEVIGYRHPDLETRELWRQEYARMCRDLHVTPETSAELTVRLAGDFDNPCDADY